MSSKPCCSPCTPCMHMISTLLGSSHQQLHKAMLAAMREKVRNDMKEAIFSSLSARNHQSPAAARAEWGQTDCVCMLLSAESQIPFPCLHNGRVASRTASCNKLCQRSSHVPLCPLVPALVSPTGRFQVFLTWLWLWLLANI